MGDTGSPDMKPILVSRDRTTKAYAAAAISKAGVDQYAVQFFVGFMRGLARRRRIFRSDGEYSLCALKRAVRDAVPDVVNTSNDRGTLCGTSLQDRKASFR